MVYAFRGQPSDATVRIALDHARAILVLETALNSGAPGAIFFAFACRGKGFGEMWPLLAPALARLVATGNGYTLNADMSELDELRMQIVMRKVTSAQVLAWFRQRLSTLN